MKTAVSIILLGMFVRCNTDQLDVDDISVPVTAGVYNLPLGEVEYPIRELMESIEDDNVQLSEDSTTLLYITYRDTLNYKIQDDFIKIPQYITNYDTVDVDNSAVSSPPPPIVGPASITVSETFSNFYNSANGETLDSIYHKTGELSVTLNSTLNGNLDPFTITLPNTINVASRSPLTLSGTLVGSGNTTVTRNLAGYETYLEEDNKFPVIFDATFVLGSGQILNLGESLNFELTFGNQTFEIIYGKFGNDTVQISNNVLNIDVFNNWGDGIYFGNPVITFDFNNSFGIPFAIDYSNTYADDGLGTPQTFVEGQITEDLLVVGSAIVTNPPPVVSTESTQTILEMNRGNSNVVNFFSVAPSRVGFDILAISNPNDNTPTNFYVPDSKIDTYIEVYIPMEIRLEDFELERALSLGSGLDVSNVDSLFMRVNSINEFPFSAGLDIEIQDADSNTLYTVVTNLILNAPFISTDGSVTDANGALVDIPFSPDGIQALGAGSHVLFTAKLNTPQSLNSRELSVKVLADYRLKIEVGLGGKLDIEL